MTTFDIAEACVELEIDLELDDLSILFPGGFELKVTGVVGQEIAFAEDYAKQLLASANAALAPLQPIFNIIEMLLVVVEFAQAVPDSLGPPPDPTAILKIIPKLKTKLDKLLVMIPPLSIPRFVKSLIRVILVFLRGLRASLSAVATLNLKIDAGRLRVGELQALALTGAIAIDVSLELDASMDCAASASLAMRAGLAQSGAPLDSLLGVIRAFVQLVGLPVEIPVLGATLGGSVSVAIDGLDALMVLLRNVNLAIVI